MLQHQRAPDYYFNANTCIIPNRYTEMLPKSWIPAQTILGNIHKLSDPSQTKGELELSPFIPCSFKLDIIHLIENRLDRMQNMVPRETLLHRTHGLRQRKRVENGNGENLTESSLSSSLLCSTASSSSSSLFSLPTYVALTGSTNKCASLILHERGIGVSCTLRRIVMAAHLTYPNVICIYTEFFKYTKDPITLIAEAILQRIDNQSPSSISTSTCNKYDEMYQQHHEEQLRSVIANEHTTPYTERINTVMNILAQRNLYCLFLADEVDEMYNLHSGNTIKKLSVLAQFSHLASFSNGATISNDYYYYGDIDGYDDGVVSHELSYSRCAVFLFGKTISVLQKKINRHEMQEIIVAKNLPLTESLRNDIETIVKKTKVFRIRQGPLKFEELKTAIKVFTHKYKHKYHSHSTNNKKNDKDNDNDNDNDDISDTKINCLSFVTGSNLAYIQSMLINSNCGLQYFVRQDDLLFPTAMWDSGTHCENTIRRFAPLIKAITKQLIKTNEKLLREMYKTYKTTNSLRFVGSTKWTEKIQGITSGKLLDILYNIPFENYALHHIHFLVDRGWFCAESKLQMLYPITVSYTHLTLPTKA